MIDLQSYCYSELSVPKKGFKEYGLPGKPSTACYPDSFMLTKLKQFPFMIAMLLGICEELYAIVYVWE